MQWFKRTAWVHPARRVMFCTFQMFLLRRKSHRSNKNKWKKKKKKERATGLQGTKPRVPTWEGKVAWSPAPKRGRLPASTVLTRLGPWQSVWKRQICLGIFVYCCSFAKSRQLFVTPWTGTPGPSALHHLPEFTLVHVHWVSDAL